MTPFIDDNLVAEFLAESREHLNAIEPDLLAMERLGGAVEAETLNRVFRAIHSIKGGSGFFAFEPLKRLSHAMEGVLMRLRDRQMALGPEVLDPLFSGIDRIRAMLDDVGACDQVPIDRELSQLESLLVAQGVNPQAQVRATTMDAQHLEYDLDAELVRAALQHGRAFYHASAYLHRDIQARGISPMEFLKNALSVGLVLDAFSDIQHGPTLENCLEVDLSVTILFATVLEPDLAALSLSLPRDQVTLLDLGPFKSQFMPQPQPAEPAPVQDLPVETGPKPGLDLAGHETLRVRLDLLTTTMNQAGELVLGRNQLLRALASHARKIPGLSAILQHINQVTSELQEGIMQMRMQPIGTVFNRFPRVVRDLARQLDKQIEVTIQGAEVELDKTIIEMLADPLTHLIRNCADHAIETPARRRTVGKDPQGLIHLHAYHESGQVNIEITDDGQGIDPQKVLMKAVDRGLITPVQAAQMTERDLINLVFAPGFSTADAVSDLSGRGVGMDVVRTNVEKLGGTVELESQLGFGTKVLLRLPLTLAIIPSMIVGVGAQRFAIPQVNVLEFVWVRAADVARRIERVHGAEVLRLRDQLLPLIHLADLLGLDRTFVDPRTRTLGPDRRSNLADRRTAEGRDSEGPDRRQHWRSDFNIVVLRFGPHPFGVVVDRLMDFEEIVVKPLSGFLTLCRCFSGATILGDGSVIMILDVGGIVSKAGLRFTELQAEGRRRAQEADQRARAAAGRRRAIILCEAGPGECFGIPQEKVLRLERVATSAIQHMGDQEFVDYRGESLPLVRLDRLMAVHPVPPTNRDVYLVLPKMGRAPVAGIVISRILDALEADVELQPATLKGPGILGSAMFQGRHTLFLDPVDVVQASGVVEVGS